MIIAIIYIFLSYMIFDQQLKITFRKSSTPHPLKKSTPPFLPNPPKNSKSVSPPLFANIEKFSGCPCRKGGRGGEDTRFLDSLPLLKGSYESVWVSLSVLCSAWKFSWNYSIIFVPKLSIVLETCVWLCMTGRDFLEQIPFGQEWPKSIKNKEWSKFLGFLVKLLL